MLGKSFSIRIVNLRHDTADFRCDRKSPLGNPHVMRNESEREQVCDVFANGFNPVGDQIEYLRSIWRFGVAKGSVTLGCWCAPKRCHCETIKKWLEDRMVSASSVH